MSEGAGLAPETGGTTPPSRGRRLVRRLAAAPLFLGGLACIALAVQTLKELSGPASANGSADWVLALAACFFIVMVVALFAAGWLLVRPQRPHLAAWVVTLVVGAGAAVVGAQQLAAADWRAFTVAGVAAAIFLAVSVYLVAVSAVGIWVSLTRRRSQASALG